MKEQVGKKRSSHAEPRNANEMEWFTLTRAEADDPDVAEVEVGDAGLGLVDLIQPAPGAPLLAKLHSPQQWRCRNRSSSLALLV